MSSLTVCEVRRDAVSLRVATVLFRHAVAWGIWVVLSLVALAFHPTAGILLLAASFPFAFIAAALSAAAAAVGRIGATAWLACVAASWLLTAPLTNGYENALDRFDPTVAAPAPAEFYWQYWPWALPATLIHAAVGVYFSRRASSTAA